MRVGRLEDPLPKGRFDLIVSALAVHHLPAAGKAHLYARIASALRSRAAPLFSATSSSPSVEVGVTPLEAGVDLPDRLDDQLSMLVDAQLDPTVVRAEKGIWPLSER